MEDYGFLEGRLDCLPARLMYSVIDKIREI